jgi:polysaccharide export outer membrane protein
MFNFKKNYIQFVCFVFIIGLSSCLSPKKLYYFNDQVPGVQNLEKTKKFNIHLIQPSDRLSISVNCPDPSLTSYLNTNSGGGYLVDVNGAIEFPMLGKVNVQGLSANEAEMLLKEKLSYYYKDLFINVSYISKVYYISGKSGGSLPIPNERLTLLEALTQLPNFDPYNYKVNDVWIIREDSGKRYFAKLNFNKKNIFESEYFYLKNNDVLYLKSRYKNSFSGATNNLKLITTVLGSVLAFYITIKNLNL